MKQKLWDHLKANVPLVGSRVYAVTAPQDGDTPYIVFSRVSEGREYSHGGYSKLSRFRYQVSCYDPVYQKAKEVADEVVEAVDSWNDVQAAFVDDTNDIWESETGLHHIPVDVIVWD